MERFPFIFSDEKKYRLRRHIYFWFFWWLFMGFLYSFAASESFLEYGERLPLSLLESLLYLISHMFLSYYLIYFVIPGYLLKEKYWQSAILVLTGFLIVAAMAAFTTIFLIRPIRIYFFHDEYIVPRYPISVTFYLSLLAGLRGGITIGGIAAAIKLMKTLYMKEQRNLQLQRQNVEAQLKILKAQVHPHFLFNTLNNIYAETLDKAPRAAQLVSGLSDILRFMLYESNNERTPLKNELKLINDYIGLEKIRYNHLDLHIDMPEETGKLTIAPLLLLPLVENCFKHGNSRLIDQAWMNLKVEICGNQMHLKLMNGKPAENSSANMSSGIGLENVRKRLELLYPSRHHLTTDDEGEVFIVNLKLTLDATNAPMPSTTYYTTG